MGLFPPRHLEFFKQWLMPAAPRPRAFALRLLRDRNAVRAQTASIKLRTICTPKSSSSSSHKTLLHSAAASVGGGP